jgi:hypothetical protein
MPAPTVVSVSPAANATEILGVSKEEKKRREDSYNGIDRVDSKGYVPDNCVPCCEPCNTAKLDRSYQEFVSWISKAAMHLAGCRRLECQPQQ